MPNTDKKDINNLININKKHIVSLFRWHSENNEENFKNIGYEICKIFDKNGDYELSEYIQAQLSDKNTFSPQKSNRCVTHHISACDCIREQILDICEAVIKTRKYLLYNVITDKTRDKARNLISTINILYTK